MNYLKKFNIHSVILAVFIVGFTTGYFTKDQIATPIKQKTELTVGDCILQTSDKAMLKVIEVREYSYAFDIWDKKEQRWKNNGHSAAIDNFFNKYGVIRYDCPERQTTNKQKRWR